MYIFGVADFENQIKIVKLTMVNLVWKTFHVDINDGLPDC